VPEGERWRYIATHEGQYPVSPEVLARGRAAAQATSDLNLPAGLGSYDDGRLSREELRAGTKAHSDVAAFAGEPRRRLLTDPPAGYRMPAANAPWGPGKETAKSTRNDPYAMNEAADRALETYGR
jgi:hypothetical protein